MWLHPAVQEVQATQLIWCNIKKFYSNSVSNAHWVLISIRTIREQQVKTSGAAGWSGIPHRTVQPQFRKKKSGHGPTSRKWVQSQQGIFTWCINKNKHNMVLKFSLNNCRGYVYCLVVHTFEQSHRESGLFILWVRGPKMGSAELCSG